jgi:hypothetical protein
MHKISRQLLRVCFLACLIALATSCEDDTMCGSGWRPVAVPERNDDQVTIEQGIWGDVWFLEGDFMPMCPSGTITPVVREIRVHSLTHRDDVVDGPNPYAPFYSEIHTDLIATIYSGTDGFFEVQLPPGQYSLFVVEDTLFYANRFDGTGHINPVEVLENEVTEILFEIDYEAAY